MIEYSIPTQDLAHQAFRARLQGLETGSVDWDEVVRAAEGLSYADVVKACEDAAKEAILGDTEAVTTETLLRALEDRRVVRGRPPEEQQDAAGDHTPAGVALPPPRGAMSAPPAHPPAPGVVELEEERSG